MSFKHGYNTIIKDGLVGYWDPTNVQSYSGGATNLHSVINNPNSTIGLTGQFQNGASIGNMAQVQSNLFGKRQIKNISLDGSNDYIQFEFESSEHKLRPDETHLTNHGFTVIANIRFDTTGAHAVWVNDGIGSLTYYGLECFINSSGKPGMVKMDGTGTSSTDRRTALSNLVLKEDTWYHVAWVYENATHTNWTIYVDGVSHGITTSGSGGSVAYSTTQYGGIGIQRGNINPFDGNINRVLCYNRKLTKAEVLQDYEAHKVRFRPSGQNQ